VRGKDSARSGVAGAGLGLSIVREVVSRHRGRLEITAGPEGRGTVATLWLPRARAPAPGPATDPAPATAHGILARDRTTGDSQCQRPPDVSSPATTRTANPS
jgi:hypothetical protein